MVDPVTQHKPADIKEAVRERYAAAAGGAGCCGPTILSEEEQDVFGASQYGGKSVV